MRFVKEVMFSCHYGSLEVIWRAFGDSKLKSDERIQLSVQKTYEKTYYMPRGVKPLYIKEPQRSLNRQTATLAESSRGYL